MAIRIIEPEGSDGRMTVRCEICAYTPRGREAYEVLGALERAPCDFGAEHDPDDLDSAEKRIAVLRGENPPALLTGSDLEQLRTDAQWIEHINPRDPAINRAARYLAGNVSYDKTRTTRSNPATLAERLERVADFGDPEHLSDAQLDEVIAVARDLERGAAAGDADALALLAMMERGAAGEDLEDEDAGEDLEDDDAGAECQGHPAGPFDPMGATVYCDGSCRAGEDLEDDDAGEDLEDLEDFDL